jgi:hypothetical protein
MGLGSTRYPPTAQMLDLNDAYVVVHAPTWLRSLLEESERITKQNDTYRGMCEAQQWVEAVHKN